MERTAWSDGGVLVDDVLAGIERIGDEHAPVVESEPTADPSLERTVYEAPEVLDEDRSVAGLIEDASSSGGEYFDAVAAGRAPAIVEEDAQEEQEKAKEEMAVDEAPSGLVEDLKQRRVQRRLILFVLPQLILLALLLTEGRSWLERQLFQGDWSGWVQDLRGDGFRLDLRLERLGNQVRGTARPGWTGTESFLNPELDFTNMPVEGSFTRKDVALIVYDPRAAGLPLFRLHGKFLSRIRVSGRVLRIDDEIGTFELDRTVP